MEPSIRSEGAIMSKQSALATPSAAHEILCYVIGLSHLRFEELLDAFKQTVGEWSDDKLRGSAPRSRFTLRSVGSRASNGSAFAGDKPKAIAGGFLFGRF